MVRKSTQSTRAIAQASRREECPRDSVRESGATADYAVGYRKPLKAHRFKPGQSGNRRGRPKPLPELSDLIRKELKRKRCIVDGGLRVSVPTIELLIKRLIEMAAKGKLPALMHVFEVAAQISAKERHLATYQLGSGRITKEMSAHEAAEMWARMIHDDTDTR